MVYNYFVSASALTGHIRRVDPGRDLNPIADLIELCFAHQMDDDGRDYLRHIRRAAHDLSFQRWMPGSNEQVPAPLFGYVWEEQGRIVGNLTLIPFQRDGVWRYLVANVATHPEFRGKGIARQLTKVAIEHVRQHGASSVWLQVRDDNPVAYQLYLQLGFIERVRRTTWELIDPRQTPPPPLDHHLVSWRQRTDWPFEEQWLRQVYPPEVAWNLNFRIERFSPGLLRGLAHLLNNDRIAQWSVRMGKDLLGFAIWDSKVFNTESFWVAPNPACEVQSLTALLSVLRHEAIVSNPISINYPAGQGAAAFQRAGFSIHNTLVWMEIPFQP